MSSQDNQSRCKRCGGDGELQNGGGDIFRCPDCKGTGSQSTPTDIGTDTPPEEPSSVMFLGSSRTPEYEVRNTITARPFGYPNFKSELLLNGRLVYSVANWIGEGNFGRTEIENGDSVDIVSFTHKGVEAVERHSRTTKALEEINSPTPNEELQNGQ